MPTFHVTFTADENAPYVPLEAMHAVEADEPMEAVRLALLKERGPVILKEQFWARVVVGTAPNGNWRVQLIPLNRKALIPYDFDPPRG